MEALAKQGWQLGLDPKLEAAHVMQCKSSTCFRCRYLRKYETWEASTRIANMSQSWLQCAHKKDGDWGLICTVCVQSGKQGSRIRGSTIALEFCLTCDIYDNFLK